MTAPRAPGPTVTPAAGPGPRRNQKASTEQIIAAYRETGSVWKAAKSLGMGGQTVHERLRNIGYPLLNRNWTDDEIQEMRDLIDNEIPLGQIANRLGRPYAGVACKASELGIRSTARRQKKLPRGAGFDKATTTRHMTALEQYGGKVTIYARANGMSIDNFVHALQKHCPDRWQAYLETHSDVPKKVCQECGAEFVPANGKQAYCTRACSATARTDRSYFGGKRSTTVGLAEGVCQLCERKVTSHLSSHHIFGKENDPENAALVALCRGCHNLVTMLGARTKTFTDNPTVWESLISLAWLRAHGDEINTMPEVLHVTVDIDLYDEDDGLDEVMP